METVLVDNDEQEQRKNLKDHLEGTFMLTPSATEFLEKVWSSCQFFDDLADNDEVSRDEINKAVWDHFVGLAGNQFFIDNSMALRGALATFILKWQASDQAERAGEASAKSYMWRAGFYDVMLLVVCLVHGYEKTIPAAKEVMDFYGETLEEYLKEFGKNV